MQAAAHNGKYGIVRQAGMDLVKIHHDLENEKQPQPIVQKPASPLNYQQFPSNPLYLPHCFRLSPSASSSLPPLNPSLLAQKSVPQLNYQQFPPNPLRSPFQLAQKCAPTPPQVQNPALKCARPFLNGFKMRAACAPRCANFPKNPISSPKTHKLPLFHFFQETTTIHPPLNHPAPKPSPCSNPCGRLTWAQNRRGCGNETI